MTERLLLLCADADDGIDFVLANRADLKDCNITTAWPWHFDGNNGHVKGKTFDRLVWTAAFLLCPRADRMLAAARTRLVNPAPVVHVTTDHAELMGLGGSDA